MNLVDVERFEHRVLGWATASFLKEVQNDFQKTQIFNAYGGCYAISYKVKQ
jgi:hypothetical protein